MAENKRKRARELGIVTGILPTGNYNAITDVSGVKVGHRTVITDDNIRTGITAVIPHSGNIYHDKVPAAIHVANGFGKLIGYTQVEELGEIETPVLLTNTLNAPKVADGLIEFMLSLPGNEKVKSINPVVGETNDGYLNDIRRRVLGATEVLEAISDSKTGPVEEGCVGAATGTVCYGFKGGIGTSSRVVTIDGNEYTVGVLIQTNFNGILTICGAPVGRELGKFYSPDQQGQTGDGSCMIVVATDAPIRSRNLKRLAKRAIVGMTRTGSFIANGSGDYSIAFSVAESFDNQFSNDQLNPLLLASVESVEEAVYNSLFMAVSMGGVDGHQVEALPVDRVIEILGEFKVLNS